ncbi:transposase [Mesorhizobium shonense]|uniref:Transposase n=1 Tax=Mesorhizobium shonense TaxID=1209948 RepID=A0ABV2HWW3_9HYPH
MMGNVTTIGLDIAKSVFQVHGVDAASEVVVRRKLTRGRVLALFESLPPCLVGIESLQLKPAAHRTIERQEVRGDSAGDTALGERRIRATVRGSTARLDKVCLSMDRKAVY